MALRASLEEGRQVGRDLIMDQAIGGKQGLYLGTVLWNIFYDEFLKE